MKIKRCLTVFFFVFVSFMMVAQPAPKPALKPVYVRAGRLFDATSDNVRENVVITILGDRIQSVGPSGSVSIPAGATVIFDDCEHLGAANLRGAGFAARDVEVRRISAKDGGVWRNVEVNVTGLAGFLLAKVAAAHGRRKAKDWYDIAFVLLHNDAGGPQAAVQLVLDTFGADLGGLTTALQDLAANFSDPRAQGPTAYAEQFAIELNGPLSPGVFRPIGDDTYTHVVMPVRTTS